MAEFRRSTPVLPPIYTYAVDGYMLIPVHAGTPGTADPSRPFEVAYYQVSSKSEPGRWYRTTAHSCECIGFGGNGDCHHAQAVRKHQQ